MTRSPILHQAQKTGDYSLRSRTVEPEKGRGRKRRPRVKAVEPEPENEPRCFLVLDSAGMRIEFDDPKKGTTE